MLYKFLRDNNGHWYLVPETDVESFNRWVEAMENDLDWPYKHYDNYRCMHPSSYTVQVVE